MIVFSRAFLSFSKDKNQALHFAEKKENIYSIFYIIQAIENAKEGQLKKSDVKNIDYEIHLKYLGCYSHYIKEQLDTNFFDLIQITTFSEELFNSGLVKINNILSKWIKKEENTNLKIQKIAFFWKMKKIL